MLNFESALKFNPPSDWLKITAIDAHTGGEPFRVIVDGFPELKGNSILERRRYAKEHYDHLRTAVMWEPRGHADMYGCILTRLSHLKLISESCLSTTRDSVPCVGMALSASQLLSSKQA